MTTKNTIPSTLNRRPGSARVLEMKIHHSEEMAGLRTGAHHLKGTKCLTCEAEIINEYFFVEWRPLAYREVYGYPTCSSCARKEVEELSQSVGYALHLLDELDELNESL